MSNFKLSFISVPLNLKKKKKAAPKIVLYHSLKRKLFLLTLHPPHAPIQNISFNCLGHGHFQDEILYFAPIASGYRKTHAFLY